MANIEIRDSKHVLKYTGPDGWSDLTEQGLLHLARLQPFLANERAKFLLLARLFDVPLKYFLLLKKAQMIQIESLLDWVFTKNRLKKWLIERVLVRGEVFFGPQNGLSNLTAEEFIYTEAAFERYLQSEKDEHLHQLFAVLYRKGHWWSGKRLTFDRNNLEKNIHATKSVQLFVKRAVMLNYAGCRNFMIASHPHIWKQAMQDKLNEKSGPTFTSWAAIFMNLAGDKFGTYAQTLKTDVWLVLTDMETKAKQAEEIGAVS